MVFKNKQNIKDEIELRKTEEKISKKKAVMLFDTNKINEIELGTTKGLKEIHQYLFEDIYPSVGIIRDVNISKGNFRFATTIYLEEILLKIDLMPESNFNEIVEKYVEMNISHPFREGNGRSMRIWLDQILKKNIGLVIDWSKINKEDYLLAMERSRSEERRV